MGDSNRPPRRRKPPLPPLWRRQEHQLLKDVDESLGLVLWHAVRQVREWAELSPDELATRQREQTPESQARQAFASIQAPEISKALGTFATLARSPRLVDAIGLAAACVTVADWAEAHSLAETSIQFAEAAAAVDPSSPHLANRAGRACRRAAEFERAQEWYERAAALASTREFRTDRGNTDEYIRAHLGAASAFYAQGRHAEAQPHLDRAAKRARSRNRRGPAGEASHDLMTLADAVGTFEEVVHHARAALESYPVRHKRVPMLVMDFAYALTRHGAADLALRVLPRIVPLIEDPSIQVPLWGTIARARALTRDRSGFEEAARRVTELATIYDEWGAAAYWNVGEGACILDEWDLAERFGASALEFARERQDGMVARLAADLLDRVAIRERAPNFTRIDESRLDRFVNEMIRRLMQWAEGRPRSRRSPP